MDSRIPRLRRKLAHIRCTPDRSHSFGEERHEFRLGPRLPRAPADAFEAEQDMELPQPYRDFPTNMGGSGAAPYYGLIPLQGCTLCTMNPAGVGTGSREFSRAYRNSGAVPLPVPARTTPQDEYRAALPGTAP
ncbi:hypothetical protein [Streptomyces sp. Tu 2975]|uniref:hypothetical protein n=1 Tax=Streptomyces sp. Tu 2975 TaxID=2676871 RepID=UPI00326492FE